MFRRRDEEENDFESNIQPKPPQQAESFGGFPTRKKQDPELENQSRETSANYQQAGQSQMKDASKSGLFSSQTKSTTKKSSLSEVTPKTSTYKITSGGAFTSASSSSSSSAPASAASAAKSSIEGVEAERRLTVGYGIGLEGKITDCDKLIIYGKVNAELKNVKALHISESGEFQGSAEIETAEISGTFEGDINVKNTITINSTGRVNGKITYGSIEIKPGGKFSGEIIEAPTKQEASVEEKPQAEAEEESTAEESSEEETSDLTETATSEETEKEEEAA